MRVSALSRRRRVVAPVVLVATVCLTPAGPPAQAAAPPAVRVKLLTADPVAVLQTGRVAVRVSATRADSVRLAAFTGTALIAAPETLRFPTRSTSLRSRTFTFALSDGARRRLDSCASTVITLVVRARGGEPTHRRFAIVCRGGRLVPKAKVDAAGGRSGAKVPAGGTPSRPTRASYEVGIGARSIAPEADGRWQGKPVYLGGYGIGGGGALTGRAATGVLGEGPSVRAFVVGDGKHLSAVADIEVQGWFTQRRSDANGIVAMRRAIAKATAGALPATRVIIQSNHSHSGADALGVWGGVPADFITHMRRQTEAAILGAWFNRRPGRLVYGAADGKDLLSNQFAYDKPNESLDSDVRVLQARGTDGRPFATLLNFSAHSTVLGAGNTLISGDWEQAANRLMATRRTAAGRPVFGRAMTMIGTFGRTQPDRGDTCPGLAEGSSAQGLCRIDDYARRVVARAEVALASATPITGRPVVGGSTYLIQDPTTNAPILGLSTLGPTAGAVVGLPFNRSALPPWQTGNVIGTVTGTLRIGDVLLSSVPGEIYPQIALAVSGTVKGIRPRGFMTAGLANDQLGYIIAPYEAYPAPVLATFLSADAGDEISSCLTDPGPDCASVVSPIGNDNYFFNVSHTLGERVVCSLLRGADDLLGTRYRRDSSRCLLFPNDLAMEPGADVRLSDRIPSPPLP